MALLSGVEARVHTSTVRTFVVVVVFSILIAEIRIGSVSVKRAIESKSSVKTGFQVYELHKRSLVLMYVRRNASGESGTTRGTSGLRKSTFVLWQVHTELFRIDTDWIECKLDNLYFLLRIFSDNIQIGIFWSDDVLILELQNQLTLCQNEIVQKFRTILIVTLSSTLFKRILAKHFKSSSLLFISTLIDYLIRFRSIFDNYNTLYRTTTSTCNLSPDKHVSCELSSSRFLSWKFELTRGMGETRVSSVNVSASRTQIGSRPVDST